MHPQAEQLSAVANAGSVHFPVPRPLRHPHVAGGAVGDAGSGAGARLAVRRQALLPGAGAAACGAGGSVCGARMGQLLLLLLLLLWCLLLLLTLLSLRLPGLLARLLAPPAAATATAAAATSCPAAAPAGGCTRLLPHTRHPWCMPAAPSASLRAVAAPSAASDCPSLQYRSGVVGIGFLHFNECQVQEK